MVDELYSELDQAAYNTVHNYMGGKGTGKLATLLRINHRTLDNKVNPTQEHSKLTIDEAATLMAITSDQSILFALAHTQDHACVPLGDDFKHTSDSDLLEVLSRAGSTNGSMFNAAHSALADNIVERHEADQVRDAAWAAVRAALELAQRFDALAQAQEEHEEARHSGLSK